MECKRFDVIVLGAGPAGFAAAVGAAQQGKSVLLIDQNSGPGGVGVFSGCPVFSGIGELNGNSHNNVVAELISELTELQAAKIVGHTLTSTETAVQLAMTRILKKHAVEMLFYATLYDVETQEKKIKSVQVFCAGTKMKFTADVFVDASGDAVLSYMAGAEVINGNIEESMTKTVLFKLSNVHSFDKVSLKERFAKKQFPIPTQDCFMGTTLTDNTILMNLSAVAGDALDPWELNRMDRELREQIIVIFNWLKKEFPEFADAELVTSAARMGVRASRNIAGKKMLTIEDIDANLDFDEPIAWGFRSYGDHFIHTFRSPWRKAQTGRQAIPYDSLKAAPIENLLAAGRCIAVDIKALTTIRLMPCCIATGLAAGTAAAMNIPEYSKLAEELKKYNYELKNFQNSKKEN